MSTNLIICMGNVARGDDGVAHEVARLLQGSAIANMADIRVSAGLDITLAEDVANAELLVLVDAEKRTAPLAAVTPLKARPSYSPTGHSIDPEGLLTLASSLYRSAPTAFMVSVAAPEMGHGEGLSQTAREAASKAASLVVDLVTA